MKIKLLSFVCLSVATTLSSAQTVEFSVDTSDREMVRQFYRSVYFSSIGAEMGWTGSYENNDAGDVSPAFREAVRLRINYYRAMAGVPAWITFNDEWNAKNQQAAFMMSTNNSLSHFPPEDWLNWTPEGREAAENANLAIGTQGPESVDGYMVDSGPHNQEVGHRRWILHPPTQVMGTGDVPGNQDYFAANSNWIFDGRTFDTYPATRENFIAWPAQGYNPYPIIPARWSIGVENADFSSATVVMTKNGNPVSVAIEDNGRPSAGHPSYALLAWVPDNLDTNLSRNIYPRPSEDTTYTVQVSNVIVNGSPQTFEYDVIVFDPDVRAASAPTNSISGNAEATVNQNANFQVQTVPFAEGYQIRISDLDPVSWIESANQGLDRFSSVSIGDYNPISDTQHFRLGHLQGEVDDQILTFKDTFLPGPNAQLNFQSRLAIAMQVQEARIQLSLDDGNSWFSVWTQTGESQPDQTAQPGETTFSNQTVDLSAYAGRTVMLRFAYAYTTMGQQLYLGVEDHIGWKFDDIQLSDTQYIQSEHIGDTQYHPDPQIAFSEPGNFALQVRPIAFGGFALAWGEIFSVTVLDLGIPANIFAEIQPVGNGWKNTFMGYIHDGQWPYVYHQNQGFLYAASDDEDIFWLKLQNNHWLWTRADIWPWVFNFSEDEWQVL